MTKINLDALNLPAIEPALPPRAGAKADREPTFDNHLQQAGAPRAADRDGGKPPASPPPPPNAPPKQTSDSDRGASSRQGENASAAGPEKSSEKEKEQPEKDQSEAGDQPAAATPPSASPGAAKIEEKKQAADVLLAAVDKAAAQAGSKAAEEPAAEASAPAAASPELTPEATDAKATAKGRARKTPLDADVKAVVKTAVRQQVEVKPATDEAQPDSAQPEAPASTDARPAAKSTRTQQSKSGETPSTAIKLPESLEPAPNGGVNLNAAQLQAALAAAQADSLAPGDDGSKTSDSTSASTNSAVEGAKPSAPPSAAPASPLRSAIEAGGKSDTHSKQPAGASEADRARFVQRVSKAFQSAGERGTPLRLRLSPPELGSLRLEVTVKSGVMSARLEAETPAARTMLLDNLPELKQRLAEHDIKVDKFDVELAGQSFDGGQQAPSDAGDRRQSPHFAPGRIEVRPAANDAGARRGPRANSPTDN